MVRRKDRAATQTHKNEEEEIIVLEEESESSAEAGAEKRAETSERAEEQSAETGREVEKAREEEIVVMEEVEELRTSPEEGSRGEVEQIQKARPGEQPSKEEATRLVLKTREGEGGVGEVLISREEAEKKPELEEEEEVVSILRSYSPSIEQVRVQTQPQSSVALPRVEKPSTVVEETPREITRPEFVSEHAVLKVRDPIAELGLKPIEGFLKIREPKVVQAFYHAKTKRLIITTKPAFEVELYAKEENGSLRLYLVVGKGKKRLQFGGDKALLLAAMLNINPAKDVKVELGLKKIACNDVCVYEVTR